MEPCKDSKWTYDNRFGACYLGVENEDNWKKAGDTCDGMAKGSTLAWIEYIGEDLMLYQRYWEYWASEGLLGLTYSWLGATVSSCMFFSSRLSFNYLWAHFKQERIIHLFHLNAAILFYL